MGESAETQGYTGLTAGLMQCVVAHLLSNTFTHCGLKGRREIGGCGEDREGMIGGGRRSRRKGRKHRSSKKDKYRRGRGEKVQIEK